MKLFTFFTLLTLTLVSAIPSRELISPTNTGIITTDVTPTDVTSGIPPEDVCLNMRCICNEIREDMKADQHVNGDYSDAYLIPLPYIEQVLAEVKSCTPYDGCEATLDEVRDNYKKTDFKFFVKYCTA